MLIKKNKLNNFYLNLSKNLRISVKKYLSFQTTLLQDKDYLVEVIDSIPNKKNLQYNLFRHRLYNFIPINIYFTELLCQLKKNRYKNNKKKKFKDLKRFFIHLKNFTSSKNFLNSKRYKTSLRRRYQVKRGKKRLKLSKEELALNYITIINLLKKKTRFEPSNETEIKDINEKRTRKKERVNKKPKKYFNYCKLFFRYTGSNFFGTITSVKGNVYFSYSSGFFIGVNTRKEKTTIFLVKQLGELLALRFYKSNAKQILFIPLLNHRKVRTFLKFLYSGFKYMTYLNFIRVAPKRKMMRNGVRLRKIARK